VETMVTNHWQ